MVIVNPSVILDQPRNQSSEARPKSLDCQVPQPIRQLLTLNADLARLSRLGLGNENGKDTILKGSLDVVLIDASWERERPMELSNRAFLNPVLSCTFRLLCDLGIALLGDLGGAGSLFRSILNGSLLGDLAFDKALRTGALFAVVLGLTGDGEGVAIGPLYADVLLLHAWELAVQLIALLVLLDIELGGPGADTRAGVAEVLPGSTIVLVDHAEERGEFVSEVWEERHCCWWV